MMKVKSDVCFFSSPMGDMFLGANEKGITFCRFLDEKENAELDLSTKHYEYTLNPLNQHLLKLDYELKHYFNGELKRFEVPIDLCGTSFQIKVWKELLKIDFGKTISYLQQAIRLGDKNAIRAVASANGKNKHAIIIPCHRVLGTNGKLTGYAGGLWRKQWLLEHEQKFSGKHVQSKLF